MIDATCLPNKPGDPVHAHTDGTWWFWEETWADEDGPWKDEEAARRQLKIYVAIMLVGRPEKKRRDHDVLY